MVESWASLPKPPLTELPAMKAKAKKRHVTLVVCEMVSEMLKILMTYTINIKCLTTILSGTQNSSETFQTELKL